MDFNCYHQTAQETANTELPTAIRRMVAAISLCEESGEVAGLIKKHIGHGHDLDSVKLTDELGDVLWYIQEIAHLSGIPLDRIARRNLEKLKARYPDGFDSERSINRKG